MSAETEKPKPRVRFCWECGRGLWGNRHVEEMVEGHKRILHKQCWKQIKTGHRDEEDYE